MQTAIFKGEIIFMTDSNVADRLKSFIESKGLSYSQFADTCGIPRPSLSQLLTGRNKKISDIMVGQIHNMFPELSIVWLLFGEGQMENWNEIASGKSKDEENSHDIFEEGLFAMPETRPRESQKIVFSSKHEEKPSNLNSRELRNYVETPQLSDLKVEKLQSKIKELQGQIENLKKNPRKVSHITVYYEDSTFETFFPR